MKKAISTITLFLLMTGCVSSQTTVARATINAVGLGTSITYRALKTAYVTHAREVIQELQASDGTLDDFNARMEPYDEAVRLLDAFADLLIAGERIVIRMEAGNAGLLDLRTWLGDLINTASAFVAGLRSIKITPPSQLTAAINAAQALYEATAP